MILLTATPYNKTYLDLSSQLRLFVEEDRDIGIRPERYLRDMRGNRISSAPPVLAANPGRIRKERLSRRLARPDAALPRAPNAQLHSGKLRAHGSGQRPQLSGVPGRTAFVFPQAHAMHGALHGGRPQPRRINMRGFIPMPSSIPSTRWRSRATVWATILPRTRNTRRPRPNSASCRIFRARANV